MPNFIPVLFISLILLEIAFLLLSRTRHVFRVLAGVSGAALLLLVSGACAFGFVASIEVTNLATRLPFQIGYGLLALAAFVSAIRVVIGTFRKPTLVR